MGQDLHTLAKSPPDPLGDLKGKWLMKTKTKTPERPAVRVIGSGEAFDTYLGNTSYLFTGKGLPTVLFDCGYQIPERLWKNGLHTNLDAICFTHLTFGLLKDGTTPRV
jgi:hypothetical protein